MYPKSNEEQTRWGLVWLLSFASWTAIGFLFVILRYGWMRETNMPVNFRSILFIPLLNCWIGAVCTPGVYWLAHRFPIERSNWRTRVPLHIIGSLLFTVVHVAARIALAPVKGEHGEVLPPTLMLGWQLFLAFTYDDALTTYWPILILVQMLDFHRRSRQKELQAVQLEAKLARAHLQALKSQLQPHFLFNTLNSISALMHIDVRAADRMISELSDLMRLTLETGDVQESTVREELEFVQGYLRIEQTRFSDRLSVEYRIDPSTYDAMVPHMLLQPLVENAVRHGIAKRAQDGRIEIGIKRLHDQLVISIKDNGSGFDLQQIPNSGLGLKNSRERLRQLYGEGQQLSAVPVPGGGVEVRVLIPYVELHQGTTTQSVHVPVTAGQTQWGGALHGNPHGSR